MKKNIIILSIIGLSLIVLNGCSNTYQNTDNQIKSPEEKIGYLEPKSENDILTGSNSSGAIISGFSSPIIISGNTINYSGLVSIQIPNDFMNWQYYRAPKFITTKESVWFFKNPEVSLIIETTLMNSGDNIDIACKEMNEGRISKKERKIIIEGQNIKIRKQTFVTQGERVKKRKIEQTNICFVRNNIHYDIRWFDNNINENDFIKSLIFN